jgi:hypothetical protein
LLADAFFSLLPFIFRKEEKCIIISVIKKRLVKFIFCLLFACWLFVHLNGSLLMVYVLRERKKRLFPFGFSRAP